MGKSRKNCCVVGCKNNYINCPPGTKFYSFPSKPWEKKQKDKWIAAVKRVKWYPTKNSFICSTHFVGNKKSMHPNDPAFVPSIFPVVYRKKGKTIKDKARFERVKRRSDAATREDVLDNKMEDNVELGTVDNSEVHEEFCIKLDKSFQINKGIIDNQFIFVCDMIRNDVGTQANIPSESVFNNYKAKAIDVETQTPADKCKGFHGYRSLDKCEKGLVDLTGVDMKIFHILVLFVATRKHSKLQKEDRVLLFLMKMKHNLSYAALGVLFGLYKTSASLIFRNVLYELSIKLKDAIFWPSKEAIKLALPPAFKIHYPKTRVIIDCSEVRCEMPKRVDQRNYMYSNYKSGYTIKFLVGIAPNGHVSFLSDCYGGRASDALITNDSGLLKLLEPGDIVLADKGFPGIEESEDNILIVVPPKVHEGHLTVDEIENTYNIATVRIQVERCIQRIKNFRILKFIQAPLVPHVDRIVRVACAIVNMQAPIIKKKDEIVID